MQIFFFIFRYIFYKKKKYIKINYLKKLEVIYFYIYRIYYIEKSLYKEYIYI